MKPNCTAKFKLRPYLHTPLFSCFFFNDTATTEIYTLSLHDALPICPEKTPCRSTSTKTPRSSPKASRARRASSTLKSARSEEHTSELQSPCNLVCRLLLEKKKTRAYIPKLVLHATLVYGPIHAISGL